MRLARIDKALEDCETHLHDTGAWNIEIERLLTYSVLVIVYEEIEQTVKTIIREKCTSITDEPLRAFVESNIDAAVRRIWSSDLAGLLSRFGSEYKSGFNIKTLGNPRAVTFYNNLIANRHDTSHSSGSNATFADVKRFYEEGHIVLDFFRDMLLTPGRDETPGQRL